MPEAGSAAEAPPPAPPPPAPSSGNGAAREQTLVHPQYLEDLRHQAATFRREAIATKEASEAAMAKAAADVAKAAADAKAQTAEASKAADARVIAAELRVIGLRAGMVDLDGLKLGDLSLVTIDKDGVVQGGEAMMDALKKAKPYLFGAAGASSSSAAPKPGADPNAGKTNAQQMTPAEYAAYKQSIIMAARKGG